MCGLAGILTSRGGEESDLRHTVGRMSATLAHRGPDDHGSWVDAEAGIALGFRRLAVIDLSERGHQPMRSASGRFVAVFNGEIYNHPELRRELERDGARFRGHSDTEVMLAAFERWGVEGAVRRFVGMFAIALWDAERRTLHLVRDRLGIKPLYVFSRPGLVAFGSELRALLAHPEFEREVDREALTTYLRYLYVPAPRSIFRGTRKLLPGHVLTLSDPLRPLPEPVCYWSVEEAARRGCREPFRGSDREAVDEGERLLSEAVRLRMRADVPFGAFLSGGIDSSTVVALMQGVSPRPVKTFTIGFGEADYDEARHASAVARHLGTDHTEVRLTPEHALSLVASLPGLFDEPLADPSQLPTFLVSQVARREVTVALSGDGGDELFSGYNRYTWGEALLGRALRLPGPVRRAAAAGISTLSPGAWDRASRAAGSALPGGLRHRLPGEKLHKVAGVLRNPSPARMYRSLLSAWQEPARVVAGGGEAPDPVDRILGASVPPGLMERMMLADQLTYLADDLLAKVDRASMAVSLEARVPLLDHRVVEFAWTLRRHQRVRGRTGKWLLREVLYRHVPREIVERPKMGFSVPVADWLRGPLRPWAEELLAPARLTRGELFHPRPVREAWEALLAGRSSAGAALWAVLVFQAWHEHWLDSATPSPPLALAG